MSDQYTPLSGIEAKEASQGGGLLPAGAYVCYIADAFIKCSNAGKVNLNIVWDIAEGDCKGWFAGSLYGHTEYLGLEGNSAPYTKHKLNKISESNSQPPISFDAVSVVDQAAAEFFNRGKAGKIDVPHLKGKFIGLAVGTSDELYKGNVQHRNYVDAWYTPMEIRAMKYTDKSGKVCDVRIPPHKDGTGGAAQQQAAQQQASAQGDVYANDIPF